MKSLKINFTAPLVLAVAAILFTSVSITSCNNSGKDAKEVADSANNTKAKTSDSSTHAETSKMDSTSSAMKSGFKDDAHFVSDAMDGGMYEIAAAKVALKNSSDSHVKDFANMMIKDHTKWGDQMKALAKTKNITVPADLSDKKKDKVNDLSKNTGRKFDIAYMDDMKSDHKDDLSEFKDARKNTKDADLQGALDKVIPGIQHHLTEATMLDSLIDKTK